MSSIPSLSRGRAVYWRRRWDHDQGLFIPDREERFQRMVDWVEATVGRRPRCIDLGCGTGSLSERLLRRLPSARCVALDHDPTLLKVGALGLGTLGGRLRWVDADLRRSDWAEALPRGRYDAAITSTAMHWLTGPELARLYRQLVRRLRPGGVFLDSDFIAFAPGARRLQLAARRVSWRGYAPSANAGQAWERWWRDIGREPALAVEWGLRQQRYPHRHHTVHTPDLDGHVRRLKAAGFREVELVWSTGQRRILAAVR